MNISLFKRTAWLNARSWWIQLGPLSCSGCRYSTGEYVIIIDVGRWRHLTLTYYNSARLDN